MKHLTIHQYVHLKKGLGHPTACAYYFIGDDME